MFWVTIACDEPVPLELDEREMRRVGLGAAQQIDPLAIEAPDAFRIAPERLDRRDLERVDLGPDPRRGAEVRDPATRSRRRHRSGRRTAAARG